MGPSGRVDTSADDAPKSKARIPPTAVIRGAQQVRLSDRRGVGYPFEMFHVKPQRSLFARRGPTNAHSPTGGPRDRLHAATAVTAAESRSGSPARSNEPAADSARLLAVEGVDIQRRTPIPSVAISLYLARSSWQTSLRVTPSAIAGASVTLRAASAPAAIHSCWSPTPATPGLALRWMPGPPGITRRCGTSADSQSATNHPPAAGAGRKQVRHSTSGCLAQPFRFGDLGS